MRKERLKPPPLFFCVPKCDDYLQEVSFILQYLELSINIGLYLRVSDAGLRKVSRISVLD